MNRYQLLYEWEEFLKNMITQNINEGMILLIYEKGV